MALIRGLLLLLCGWFALGALLSLVGLLVAPRPGLALLVVFSGLTYVCFRLARLGLR